MSTKRSMEKVHEHDDVWVCMNCSQENEIDLLVCQVCEEKRRDGNSTKRPAIRDFDANVMSDSESGGGEDYGFVASDDDQVSQPGDNEPDAEMEDDSQPSAPHVHRGPICAACRTETPLEELYMPRSNCLCRLCRTCLQGAVTLSAESVERIVTETKRQVPGVAWEQKMEHMVKSVRDMTSCPVADCHKCLDARDVMQAIGLESSLSLAQPLYRCAAALVPSMAQDPTMSLLTAETVAKEKDKSCIRLVQIIQHTLEHVLKMTDLVPRWSLEGRRRSSDPGIAAAATATAPTAPAAAPAATTAAPPTTTTAPPPTTTTTATTQPPPRTMIRSGVGYGGDNRDGRTADFVKMKELQKQADLSMARLLDALRQCLSLLEPHHYRPRWDMELMQLDFATWSMLFGGPLSFCMLQLTRVGSSLMEMEDRTLLYRKVLLTLRYLAQRGDLLPLVCLPPDLFTCRLAAPVNMDKEGDKSVESLATHPSVVTFWTEIATTKSLMDMLSEAEKQAEIFQNNVNRRVGGVVTEAEKTLALLSLDISEAQKDMRTIAESWASSTRPKYMEATLTSVLRSLGAHNVSIPALIALLDAPTTPAQLNQQAALEVRYLAALAPYRLAILDRASLFADHYFRSQPDFTPLPEWSKRINKEMGAIMTSNVQYWDSSVLIAWDASHLARFRALIFPNPDTPYGHGAFLFDLFLPNNFPSKCPSAHSMTNGEGRVRFNPNLYAEGKVCLSLLGTWNGPSWNAASSSIHQVIMSIQSMILWAKPITNEPGHENAPEEVSDAYNLCQSYNTIVWSMMPLIKAIRAACKEKVAAAYSAYRDAELAVSTALAKLDAANKIIKQKRALKEGAKTRSAHAADAALREALDKETVAGRQAAEAEAAFQVAEADFRALEAKLPSDETDPSGLVKFYDVAALESNLTEYKCFAPALVAHFTLKREAILRSADAWMARVNQHRGAQTLDAMAKQRMGYGAVLKNLGALGRVGGLVTADFKGHFRQAVEHLHYELAQLPM